MAQRSAPPTAPNAAPYAAPYAAPAAGMRRLSRGSVRLATAIVGCAVLGCVLAFGPSDALLRSEGPRVRQARERVQLAEDTLDTARAGVTASLAALPALSYGADIEDPASFDASVAVGLDVGYTYDSALVLREQIALERARTALRDAYRWEGKQALELYGALLRSRLAHAGARESVANARAARDAAAGGGDAFAIAYADLDLRDAELEAAHEFAKLENLARDAAELGLRGEPSFEAALFALPTIDGRNTPGYRIRDLALARTQALLDRQRLFGVVQSIELAARYESRTDRYQLDTSVGLDLGRPTVGAAVEYRPQQDDQWTVELTARIALDHRTGGALADAERSVAAARRDRADYLEQFAQDAAEELRLAEMARERLQIAVDTWRTRLHEIAALRASGADTRREDRTAVRDLDRVYLAWLRYIEEVDDYLELVGAGWQIIGSLD